MRGPVVVVLSILMACAARSASARQTPPGDESDVAAFRRLRAEAVAAASAEDLAVAAARLAEADLRIPNHPGLILMRARVAAAAGEGDEAMKQVGRYARGGLTFNMAGDRALSGLADHPGHAAALAAIEANRTPVGADRISPLLRIPGPVIAEGVVRDEARNRWLVSQVKGRTIVAIDDGGVATPFLATDADAGGVLGMAVDAESGVLWAATSPLAPAIHGLAPDAPRPVAGLLEIDLATGAIRARHAAPPGPAERGLGDVVRTADGVIYVADSIAGEILMLRPGADALTTLVPAGTLGSPQGMVGAADGALIVADYSSGLWRIDRTDGAAFRLPGPADASLIGIDGLTTDGRVLYGFQNGVAPQRVLRLTLAPDGSAVSAVEVLAANLPIIDEPTTGLVHDRELVFVSRSQWSDFDGQGAQTTASPEPAIIARLSLD